MIEQNKYTDETIHVANWLLLSGNVDMEAPIAEAQWEVETYRKPDWEEEDYQEQYRECFQYALKNAVENAISEAMPDVDAGGIVSQRWGFLNSVEDIQESSPTWFLTPFISQAFEKVSFEDVADLVWKNLRAEIHGTGFAISATA